MFIICSQVHDMKNEMIGAKVISKRYFLVSVVGSDFFQEDMNPFTAHRPKVPLMMLRQLAKFSSEKPDLYFLWKKMDFLD